MTDRITDDLLAVDPVRPSGHVHFRPGRQFGKMLRGLAEVYGISVGEMVRRCAVMGLKGFDPTLHYDAIDELHTYFRAKHGPRHESWLLTVELCRENLAAKAEEFGAEFTATQKLKILEGCVKVTKAGLEKPVEVEIEVPAS